MAGSVTDWLEELRRLDALKKLARYAQHSDACAIVWDDPNIVWDENSICTCGLSALLKEIAGE